MYICKLIQTMVAALIWFTVNSDITGKYVCDLCFNLVTLNRLELNKMWLICEQCAVQYYINHIRHYLLLKNSKRVRNNTHRKFKCGSSGCVVSLHIFLLVVCVVWQYILCENFDSAQQKSHTTQQHAMPW